MVAHRRCTKGVAAGRVPPGEELGWRVDTTAQRTHRETADGSLGDHGVAACWAEEIICDQFFFCGHSLEDVVSWYFHDSSHARWLIGGARWSAAMGLAQDG
jgi:hypothetical protein